MIQRHTLILFFKWQKSGKRKIVEDDDMDDAFGKRSKRKGGDFGEEYRAKVSHCIEVFFTFVFNQFDYFLLFNLNF